MSYNTQFKVKYHNIEQELMNNLKLKTLEEYDSNVNNNSDVEYEYSSEDVIDICNKLYRDEFLSVFEAEELNDDKIDNGMKYIHNIMMTNENFKQIIDEIANLTSNEFNKDQLLNFEQKESIKQLSLISLFSQNLFHITHKCICQQIEVGTIDDNLLVELRKYSVDLFKNQFGV
jgi:hypothetical protein